MTLTSFGDIAHSFQMRKQQSALRNDIERLTYELTTGRVSNVSEKVLGDFRPISSIENGLGEVEARLISIDETQRFAEAMQSNLD